jgi:hypothetical protein
MATMTTETIIYLDEALLKRIERFIPLDGLSALVIQLLEERVQQLERTNIDAAMQEGYLATRSDRRALNADWEAIDGESWSAAF